MLAFACMRSGAHGQRRELCCQGRSGISFGLRSRRNQILYEGKASMSNQGVVKNAYRTLLSGYTLLAGAQRAKEIDAKVRFGRRLDLKHPKTLADKVSWLGLNGDLSRAAQLTDKYSVRSYVADRGFAELLIPLAGGPWTDASQIDIAALPQSFVLKATHGCEMNYIARIKPCSTRHTCLTLPPSG